MVAAIVIFALSACNGENSKTIASVSSSVTPETTPTPIATTYPGEYQAYDYSSSPNWYTRVTVAQENLNAGSSDWRITNPACVGCRGNVAYNEADAKKLYGSVAIQGYASKTSVNPGEQINFHVSTGSPTTYTLKVFRLGWYGGEGGRLLLGPINLVGNPQPVPDPKNDGLIECQWPVAYTLTVPDDWVSGIYLAKLQTAAGRQSYIIFVVRDDSRPSAYLYVSGVNTYQAYNEWGGSSLYTHFKNGDRKGKKTGYVVSFDRPYWRDDGSGDFLSYEINMVRWLERKGIDVTYATDTDLDERPTVLLRHKAILIVGHSEYWSWRMRANLERARDQGVSLGFFAGNSVYWQVRYAADNAGISDRRLIAYKEDAARRDPYATENDSSKWRYNTSFWSDLEKWKGRHLDRVNRPEEALIGVETELNKNCCTKQGLAIGNITVTDPATWPAWLSSTTGLYPGAVLPNVLGYEVDAVHGYQPVNTVIIARSLFPKTLPENQQSPANATVYTAPSGAAVFAAGSINWDLGLDDYGLHPGDMLGRSRGVVPAVQQLTNKFLEHALEVTSPLPRSTRLPATITATDNQANGVQLDLGAREWVQKLHWHSTKTNPALANYTIQISADGIVWQTVVAHAGISAPTEADEPLNQQARYLRLIPLRSGTRSTSADFSGLWAVGAPPPPIARLRTLGNWRFSGIPFTGYVIDLGDRQQITRIGWQATADTAQPVPCTVRVSDGGDVWHTVLAVSIPVSGKQNLALSAQGRYLLIQTPPGSDILFQKLWAEGTSVSAVLGAQGSGKTEVRGFAAANAVDGTVAPWLESLDPSPNNNHTWFQLDFGSRRQINRLQWRGANGSPYNAASPTDYLIQVSDDASTWKTVLVRNNSRPVMSGDELLNTKGRYLRLVVTKVGDGSGWPLALFAIWAEGY